MQNDTIPQPPGGTQNNPGYVPSSASTPKKEGWQSVLSTVFILIATPLVALFLTTFVFQSYEVDGPSMEVTLQNRDRLIVLKTGKTWSGLTRKDYIPPRGEIIVFHKEGLFDFGGNEDRQLIKRVIALPGERIAVKDGKVTVFNEERPAGFNPDKEAAYGSVIQTTPGNLDMTVPDGHVFVMGDNRTNSRDSRDFGPVSSDEIVGNLALRIFPLNKLDSF